MSFKSKVVMVTGASSGIGAATAVLFAKEGASVVITGRNEQKLKKVKEECEKHGADTLIIIAELNKDEELKKIVEKTIEKFNKIDVLVNNAAIYPFGSILDDNIVELFDKAIRTNLRSVVYLTHLAAPYLIKTKGNIINISSVCGTSFLGNPKYLPYSVSKAGMDHFTRGVALDLASHGVRVNTVSPGPVNTDILINNQVDKTWDEIRDILKLDRVSDPEEIGDLIVYLASDKAKSITGSNYTIDMGTLLKN